MAIIMLDNIKMISNMERVRIIGVIIENLRANGLKINNMVKEFIHGRIKIFMKDSFRME